MNDCLISAEQVKINVILKVHIFRILRKMLTLLYFYYVKVTATILLFFFEEGGGGWSIYVATGCLRVKP